MKSRAIHNQKNTTPLQIIILGATGDLAERKLIPALFHLYEKKKLPRDTTIIGLARKERSNADYQEFAKQALKKHKQTHKPQTVRRFIKHLRYIPGDFSSHTAYVDLRAELLTRENKLGTYTNKLYYLAVPPQYYATIFGKLHAHKLHRECNANHSWARILVEKPFGSDLNSAKKLDRILGTYFNESQIYRIDHYLAKEAVQNILSFRFANTLMRSVWNRKHISHVEIDMLETIDVAKRAAFYDEIGALRDVGQNHLLQLFALLTMDEPSFFEPQYIRKARVDALRHIKQIRAHKLPLHFIRAQYGSYRTLEEVTRDSETETFFQLRCFSTKHNLRDVPFTMTAGKALNEAKVEVRIYLTDVASGLFETQACKTVGNVITLTISPEQQMKITLNAKTPGLGFQIESRSLSFDCPLGKDEVKNSYEKVLLDCINGDQTLFTTTKEVLAAWKFITPICKHMNEVPLQRYRKGSRGPRERLPDAVQLENVEDT